MSNYNTVYLLVGPRGSGKSQYTKGLIERNPSFSIISRDEILISEFGSTDTNPYTGAQHYAQEILNQLLREKLSQEMGIKIILDTWTGDKEDRQAVIRRLRGFGATRIIALYFITPVEQVREWFWRKPGIAKIAEMREKQGHGFVFFSEDAPERDYSTFHKLAKGINSDGFYKVIRVNPLEPVVELE